MPYEWLVAQYAVNIYKLGATTFTYVQSTRPTYVEPVKQYAALNFTLTDIDAALANNWITQQEYDDTIAYIPE